MNKEPKITVEGDLKNLKRGDGIDGYEYGSNLQTEGVPVIDPAKGKPIVIRTFEFKTNPQSLKHDFDDKQQIFNTHAKQIAVILWGDGLVPVDYAPPRVVVSENKRNYRIFVPCEAKRDVIFADKPRPLSEQLRDTSRN